MNPNNIQSQVDGFFRPQDALHVITVTSTSTIPILLPSLYYRYSTTILAQVLVRFGTIPVFRTTSSSSVVQQRDQRSGHNHNQDSAAIAKLHAIRAPPHIHQHPVLIQAELNIIHGLLGYAVSHATTKASA
jgi:hypothetical protein